MGIPDRNTVDADWILHRVDNDFHAASHIVGRESGDFIEDCGAAPLLAHTTKEDEEYIGDRVDELEKIAAPIDFRHGGEPQARPNIEENPGISSEDELVPKRTAASWSSSDAETRPESRRPAGRSSREGVRYTGEHSRPCDDGVSLYLPNGSG